MRSASRERMRRPMPTIHAPNTTVRNVRAETGRPEKGVSTISMPNKIMVPARDMVQIVSQISFDLLLNYLRNRDTKIGNDERKNIFFKW